MRTRNNKINVFLNDEEKQMLITKSKQANISQSDFFRTMIQNYTEKNMLNNNTNAIIISLSNIVDNLSILSDKLGRLYYYELVSILESQISKIKKVIDDIQS